MKILATLWNTLKKPPVHISLGVIIIVSFFAGIVFWGGFNTAMEYTNTEEFCVSCHEMEDNVYQELQTTVHWSNRTGVRAICSDCHVPHDWTAKIARKMQASKEVWGAIFGTIDTPEKLGSPDRHPNEIAIECTDRAERATRHAIEKTRW